MDWEFSSTSFFTIEADISLAAGWGISNDGGVINSFTGSGEDNVHLLSWVFNTCFVTGPVDGPSGGVWIDGLVKSLDVGISKSVEWFSIGGLNHECVCRLGVFPH